MNGKALKDYLDTESITVTAAAETLGITRATLHNWLQAAEFDKKRKEIIRKAFKLPSNFFDQSVSQVGEGNINYGSVSAALAECEKIRAVLEERVLQLTERLAEKDVTIKLLTKQLR